jgi:hypothetical protein
MTVHDFVQRAVELKNLLDNKEITLEEFYSLAADAEQQAQISKDVLELEENIEHQKILIGIKQAVQALA